MRCGGCSQGLTINLGREGCVSKRKREREREREKLSLTVFAEGDWECVQTRDTDLVASSKLRVQLLREVSLSLLAKSNHAQEALPPRADA